MHPYIRSIFHRKWISAALPLVVLLVLVMAGNLPARPAQAGQKVTIFCQNDVHGWMYPDPHVVSWSRLARDLMATFASQPNTFYINAGDLLTGPPFPDEWKNRAEIGIWNRFWDMFAARGWGKQVMMALGNHDLDRQLPGPDTFHGGILCANLYDQSGRRLFTPYRLITTRTGLKVAMVGLVMENLSTVVDQNSFQGLTVRPMLKTLEELVPKLGRPDLLILIVHADVEDIETLARAIPSAWGVDLMVTGHNHLPWNKPRLINGISIAQCGAYNKYLGIWNLTVNNRRIVASRFELKSLVPNELESFEIRAKEAVDEAMGPQIAILTTPLLRNETGHGDSTASNMVADAFRWKTGTDIAFTNTSSVRADLNLDRNPEFVLKAGHMRLMVPFGNHLVTTRLTGQQLMTILEGEAITQRNQVSGLTYVMDTRLPEGHRIVEVRVGGNPLQPDAVYTLTFNDFSTADSKVEKYLHIPPGILQWTATPYVDYEVMTEFAREKKVLSYPEEGRIKDLAAPSPSPTGSGY